MPAKCVLVRFCIDFRGFIAGMTPGSPGAVRPALVNSGVFFAGVLRGLGETK